MFAISSASVVMGPWPLRTVVAYGSEKSFFWMESIIALLLPITSFAYAHSPPSKSVRPMEPLNSVSPANRKDPKR